MATMALRVVVADDSLLVREGVVRLLEAAGFEVVAEAGDGDELLAAVRAHRPDAAVVDIRMPPTHTDEGVRAAGAIRAEFPQTGVLVLSQHAEEGYALRLLGDRPEGVGYLLKDRVGDARSLAQAVRQVAQGGSALDPEVVAHMLERQPSDGPLDRLSPSERTVLARMAEGLSNGDIASELDVGERAVGRHVSSIFAKLGLAPDESGDRRVLAVLTYLRDQS
jgi:DNA-binding NarL/FixJ family response regulator